MKKLLVLIALGLWATLAQAQTFVLSEGSEARFYINEVLLGQDKTVIGTTTQVTGDIQFDLANPQAATVGTISVNVRELSTDDNRRNNQIQNRILESTKDEFQFIIFEPSSISGLPASTAVGDSFNVQMIGNLTIHGVTQEQTFEVSITVVSETELQGLGATMILHQDYELSIPRVPLVARVDDEVKLEIAFTAVANQ
jgi:polyisoprenoid-binding protein YceI